MINNKDNLVLIFNNQQKLQKHLGINKVELLYNQEFININLLALFDEITEVMRETAWKNPKHIKYGWKKTQNFNIKRYKKELIDVLHFYINLCLAAGLTPEELTKLYLKKNKKNKVRKNENY